MTINNPQGMHEYYTLTDRHWHAGSESYTGGDSLLTAIRNGWQLLNLAYEQSVQLRGGRTVNVICFQFIQESERMTMPVVVNPFVEQLLVERKMMLRPMREATPLPEKDHNNLPTIAVVRA
ncbi:MAG: hypothetical protein Q9P01_15205 [Anaerolineae bacterium]|nr:hypothetical protein [Anaerolineae bacterium]MDQ7036125.1 hypothetical protein [Anaerolineae bacterium]